MKKLVTWFSAGGVTAKKAKALAKAAGADLQEIAPKEKYTGADLDWTNKNSRCSRENADPTSRPALAEEKTDLSAYDVIYIGFPIWWGVAPRIINTFIESNDLAGKKIVLFATSGGTGISNVCALDRRYCFVYNEGVRTSIGVCPVVCLKSKVQ